MAKDADESMLDMLAILEKMESVESEDVEEDVDVVDVVDAVDDAEVDLQGVLLCCEVELLSMDSLLRVGCGSIFIHQQEPAEGRGRKDRDEESDRL